MLEPINYFSSTQCSVKFQYNFTASVSKLQLPEILKLPGRVLFHSSLCFKHGTLPYDPSVITQSRGSDALSQATKGAKSLVSGS